MLVSYVVDFGAKKVAGGFGGALPVIGVGTFSYPYNFVKNDFKKSVRKIYLFLTLSIVGGRTTL